MKVPEVPKVSPGSRKFPQVAVVLAMHMVSGQLMGAHFLKSCICMMSE
jgi:hypothetical protein